MALHRVLGHARQEPPTQPVLNHGSSRAPARPPTPNFRTARTASGHWTGLLILTVCASMLLAGGVSFLSFHTGLSASAPGRAPAAGSHSPSLSTPHAATGGSSPVTLPIAGVQLSPSTETVGSLVTATGAGFLPTQALNANFSGQPLSFAGCSAGTLSNSHQTVTTTAGGAFVCTFDVPAVPSGSARLVISGATNGSAPGGTGSGGPGSVTQIPIVYGSWGVAYDPALGEVFVTNINDADVTVINDSTNNVVGQVGVGFRPHSDVFDSGTNQVFVANYDPYGPGSVSVIDAATVSVVATVSVGTEPDFLAYDSVQGEIFVSNYGSGNVSVISDVTDQVVATIPVGDQPQGIAYDSGTGQVFEASGSGNVTVIDATTDQVAAIVEVGSDPWGVAYDPATSEVFVTLNASTNVSVISDASDQIVGLLSVGVGPTGATYNPMSDTIWVDCVANSGPGTVVSINGTANTVITQFGVGNVSFSVAYDSGAAEMFVPNQDSDYLSVIGLPGSSNHSGSGAAGGATEIPSAYGSWGVAYDPGQGEVFVSNINYADVAVVNDSTNTIVSYAGAGYRPHSDLYDPGTDQVFVADYNPGGPGSVSVINAANATAAGNVTVGSEPDFLAYDPVLGEVFSSNYGSSSVSVISDLTDQVVATIPVGDQPQGIAYDGGTGQIFVACASGNVSVIGAATNQVVATIAVGSDPWGVVYDSGTGDVFVTQNASTTVSVISDASDQVVASVSVGVGPTGAAYDPASGTVFVTCVANVGAGTVVAINDSTYWVVAQAGVGDVSFSVAYDSGAAAIFVPNQDSAFVSVFTNTTAVGTLTVVPSVGVSSSASGAVGSNLTLNGQGYAATSSITFAFGGTPVSNQSPCTTASNGSFAGCTFPVPSSVSGSQVITATDASSHSATTTFLVLAHIAFLSAASGIAGSNATLSGTGYAGTSAITIQFNGTTVTQSTCTTDGAGSFSGCTFQVPALSPGSYAVTATDGRSHSNANMLTFDVTKASVPTFVVTFLESGLSAGATWQVTLSGATGGTPVLHTAAGGSPIAFRVTAGKYQYSAGATGYVSASGSISVPGAAPATVSISFVPVSSVVTPPTNNGAGPGQITQVWVLGLAIAAIGAVGLSATTYRYRARRIEEGKVLVDRLFEVADGPEAGTAAEESVDPLVPGRQ